MVRLAAILTLTAGLLAGCGNKRSRQPESGLTLMTAPTNWAPLIGNEVQIIGTVSRAKVPTILGVEIDASDVEPGSRASAIGVVDAVIIPEQDPADPPAATRGPGTYYRLIDPRTSRLATAEPVHTER